LLKEIVIAIQSYQEAHRLIQKHRLWKWILMPGIIYALLLSIGIYFFGKSATGVIDYLTTATGLGSYIQQLENSWLGFFFTFAGIILWLILILFYFSLFKYVILLLGSPVFTYLSHKTEAILENKKMSFSWPSLMKDYGRSMRVVLRNLVWQTIFFLLLVLLTLIPVIGWVTPLIALFFECYYYGFSMLDYACSRQGIHRLQSIPYIGRHRGLAIGNGLMFFIMHIILLAGWVLAPAYAIIAANLSLYKVKTS
jgi:CysZ protein